MKKKLSAITTLIALTIILSIPAYADEIVITDAQQIDIPASNDTLQIVSTSTDSVGNTELVDSDNKEDNNDGNNGDNSNSNNDGNNDSPDIEYQVTSIDYRSTLDEINERLESVLDVLNENKEISRLREHNIDDIYKAISENGYQKKSMEATENIMVALYDIKALLEAGEVSNNAISDNEIDRVSIKENEQKKYENIISAISENTINEIYAISENRQALSNNYVLLKELKDNDFVDIKYALFACALGIWGLLGFHLEQTIFKRLRS